MSVSMLQLLLALLLNGVFAWLASNLIHMLLKYHNHDYHQLDNESDVSTALGNSQPAPGIYTLPHCTDMKEMADPAVQKKWNDGPVAMISILPNDLPPMGKLLTLQFIYFVLGCVFIAYLASLAVTAGSAYMQVFYYVSIVGFVTFGFANIPYSLWYSHP